MGEKLKLEDILEPINVEKTIIEMVERMCIQSVDPEGFECWEKVKAQLYINRSYLKESIND